MRPLPNIMEILDQLGSAKYFSVFDLASGFHQIPIHESDAHKTTFSNPHGHYQFNRMSFGLKKCTCHFPKIHGSGIIRVTKEYMFVCLFILTTLLFIRLPWPSIR